MDFYTDLGFTIVLRILKDRGASKKARSAMLKVFRNIWANFSEDQDFRNVVIRDITEP